MKYRKTFAFVLGNVQVAYYSRLSTTYRYFIKLELYTFLDTFCFHIKARPISYSQTESPQRKRSMLGGLLDDRQLTFASLKPR